MTQATPPGLEAVLASCYHGSFRTWSFENDIMAEFEGSQVEESEFDEDFIPEQREDNSLKTEHYFIDHSPETSKQSNSEDRTVTEIRVQTETTLSLTAADVKWTPTIETFVVERNIDKSGMSILDRAIFAQECDDLLGFTEQRWKTAAPARVTWRMRRL